MLERHSSAGSSPTTSSHGHHRRQSSQAYAGVPNISPEYRWRLKLGSYLSLVVLGLVLLFTYEQPNDVRYGADVRRAVKYPKAQGYSNGEKVFIAAMFHNNENVVPYWGNEIIKAVQYIGIENMFVSIVESYSTDATTTRLKDLSKTLLAMRIPHRIVLSDITIPRPASMETAPARINFLAATRNRALEPLVQRGGYDRVIFSNDVFVRAESVVELLSTRGGAYDMVCGLDMASWGLYDSWVTRDRLGGLVSSLWPYLLEDAGMRAIMADDPAPVFSCWNGIVAMRAAPFYPPERRSTANFTLSTAPHPSVLPASHPLSPLPADTTPATAPALRFRASEPDECFSSESFLLPYDLRRVYALDEIYINPRVVTAYDWSSFVWWKYITRHWVVKWWIERWEGGAGMHLAKMIIGSPEKVWRWDGGECHPV
ncbi:glycosyltransferase family 69 protein [Plicaturopsis crispa FD-325 SS-3]|nr:glycosyltransferase family 69 protein [Plicaturopsis crispa FD-325 SS-3]